MNLLLLVYLMAVEVGVDPRLAISVASQESNFNTRAIGTQGDIGLFQVRHELVPETKEDLFDPATNIRVALRLLKEAKTSCGKLPGSSWVNCFNRGITGGKKLQWPESTSYYTGIMVKYNCLKKYRFSDLVFGEGKECL